MSSDSSTGNPPSPAPSTGRIDVHAHLLPAVDDGCENVQQSLLCAKTWVEAGYTHAFCTPHVWPNLPHNNVHEIPRRTAELQSHLDEAAVPLKLLPGGEIGLTTEILNIPREQIVTFAMMGRWCLCDLWTINMPDFFVPAVRRLQSMGLRVILAHPERMHPVQADPSLIDRFHELGLLLQGNLQCFADPLDAITRHLAERWLQEGRYFLLGSDTHRPETLSLRVQGLGRAIELVGAQRVNRLTIDNPRMLLD